MAFTFVHASDLHLDCPPGGLRDVPTELAQILKESTFAAFDNVVEVCLETQAAFLVVAGDVYNARDKSLRAQLRFRAGLKRRSDAGIGSYVVCGNHDPASGWNASLDWPERVHFFPPDNPTLLRVVHQDREIAEICGISYSRSAVTEDLAARLTRSTDAPFAIALLHCNCGQSAAHESYSPCRLSDLADKGFDYWALGHIHKREVLREHDPLVVYPGNSQGLNPKETGPKGCCVVNVDDSARADVEFVETDVVRWFSEEVSAEEMTRDEDPLTELRSRIDTIRREAGRTAIVRFALSGRTQLHKSLQRSGLDGIAQDLNEELGERHSVWVESIIDLTRPDIDIDARRKSEDFVGDFLRAIDEARKDARMREELKDALEPLLGHGSARKYLDRPDDEQMLRWLDEAEVHGLDALLGEEG